MTVRYISCGGGLQSTVLVLLWLAGRLKADFAIFADTGSETPSTYATIAALKARCEAAGLLFYTVASEHGKLDEYYLERAKLPMVGVVWCTTKFKIAPIRKQVRAHLAEHGLDQGPKPWAITYIGITCDERQRMHPSDVLWSVNEFPLVDMDMTREDCKQFLLSNHPDLAVSKSGCFCCPYSGPKSWAKLRREHPELFAKALLMEQTAQADGVGRGLWGERSILAFDSDVTLADFGIGISLDDSTCDSGGCFI